MAYCKKCGNEMPDKRKELGYNNCTNCSTEPRCSGVPIIHHKTGNEIQIIKDPEVAADFMTKSSRKGFGTLKGLTGNSRKPVIVKDIEIKKIVPIFKEKIAVINRKKIVDTYTNEQSIINDILLLLDKNDIVSSKQILEDKFQKLQISPITRKQLLHLIDTHKSNK